MSAELIIGQPRPGAARPLRSTILQALAFLILAVLLATAPLRLAALLMLACASMAAVLVEPAAGLLLIAVAIPWAKAVPAPIPFVGLVEICIALTLVSWVLRGAAERRLVIRISPLAWTLLGFVWIAGLSLTQAVSWREGLPEWLKWVEFAAVYIAGSQILGHRSVRWLVGALLLAGISQAALGAYQFLAQVGPEGFVLPGGFMRAHGTLEQPNPYAGYLGYLLPVAASLTFAWLGKARGARDGALSNAAGIGALVATAALGSGILMSWSRGAWLGAAAAVAVVIIAHGRRTMLVAGAAAVLLVGATVLAGPEQITGSLAGRLGNLGQYFDAPDPARTEITDENFSVLERLAHWRAGLAMFDDAPWLGVGIGNYGVAYAAYHQPYWYDPLGHAHNVFINFMAETGALGTTAFLVFWVAIAVVAFRSLRGATSAFPRAMAVGVLGAWTYLTVHSFFDNLFVQHLQLQLALLLAGLAALTHDRSTQSIPYSEGYSMGRGTSAQYTMSSELPPFIGALLRLPIINRLGLADRPREFKRFLKFAIVGAIGMVVDLSVLTASRELLKVPLPLAVGLGFTTAVISNFTWNRLWTFPESRERPLGGQLLQFVAINVMGLGINELVVLGLHPLFSRILPDPPAYLGAKIIAIGIVLFWNYFVNRKWTYRGID